MRFSEIAARLTGISTPIFGVSWTPPQSDVDAVRRTLIFLEDRRVLYAPDEVEVPQHCHSPASPAACSIPVIVQSRTRPTNPTISALNV